MLNNLKKSKLFQAALYYSLAYICVGALAVVDSKIPRKEQFDPQEITFKVKECTLENHIKFHILGERHLYNYSSSQALNHFFDTAKPTVLLSEGIGPNLSQTHRNIDVLWTYDLIATATHTVYESPWEMAYQRKIPVHYLEKENGNTGFPQGIASWEIAFIHGNSAFSLLTASFMYFGVKGLYFLDKHGILPEMGYVNSPIVTERNKFMASEVLSYLQTHPSDKALMQVGKAHLEGILNHLGKAGKLECNDVPLTY